MASMERPALAQVGNLVAPPSRSLSAATHVPQGSSRTQFGAQVQTGETWKTAEDLPPGHAAYKSFSSAMENCAAISMHFKQFQRIQKGVKEMEPLLVRLKKDKLQVENARDAYAAKAAEAHQHVLKLLARNEELEAEIAYTENELVLRVDVEKERADKYLHDKVMAEKALEDAFAVNVSLQKQVLELQKKNSLLLAESKTVNTVKMASQTIPEDSEVSTQNACTSTGTDFDSNAAFAGDDTPCMSHLDSDLKIEEKVSAAQGTLQGVKKVQEEMMKSILQQMDALENQHICLQLGQVLLEDSPSGPAATLSPISCYKVGDTADEPASPVAVTAVQWNPNPIFNAPDSQPQAGNEDIVASSTAAASENATDSAPAVRSLADGLVSVSGTSATEGEVPSRSGRAFKGPDKQRDAADSSECNIVALHTTALRFSPMNIAATKHSSSPTIAAASLTSTHEQVASTTTSWTLTPYSFTPNSPLRALLGPKSPNTSAAALQRRFLSPHSATSISAQPRHSDAYSLVQQSAAVSSLGPSSPIRGLLSAGSPGDVRMGFMQPLSPTGLMTSPGSCLQIRPWQPFSMRTPLTGASSQIMPLSLAQCSDICEEKVDDTTRHDSTARPVEAPESTGASEAPSAGSCDVSSNIQHSVLEKDQSEGVSRASAPSLPVDAQEKFTHYGVDEEDAQSESLSCEMSEEINADSDDESSVRDSSFGDGGDEVPESEVDGLNYDDFKLCMTVGEFQNTSRHGTEFEDADYSPQDDEDSASSGSDDEEVNTTDARRQVQKLLHDQLYSGLAVLVRCEHDDPDYYPPQTDAHPFDCAEFSFDDSSASDDEDYVPELTRIQEEGSEESCSEASSLDYGSDSDEALGSGSDSDLDSEGLSGQESSHASSSEAGDSDAESDADHQEEQPVSKSNLLPVVAYRPIIRQAMPLQPACKIVRFSTAGKSVDADKYLRNVGY